MTAVVEFLRARIQEDRGCIGRSEEPESWCDRATGCHYDAARLDAEADAKEAIVNQHKNEVWQMPAPQRWDPHQYVMHGNSDDVEVTLDGSHAGWISFAEYCKRTGATVVLPPELLALAAIYADHPDYQKEWSL